MNALRALVIYYELSRVLKNVYRGTNRKLTVQRRINLFTIYIYYILYSILYRRFSTEVYSKKSTPKGL